jgi:hypothetical protein
MANEIPDIPLAMRKVYRRLRRWRSSHARREPLSDSLCAAAGELAREHGINRTAEALHLEYGKLKERAEALGQENGAEVGDLFMSLIHTCELNGANPFYYLTELQKHASELAKNPAAWMPWNYRETLKQTGISQPPT